MKKLANGIWTVLDSNGWRVVTLAAGWISMVDIIGSWMLVRLFREDRN